ncbi:MAG: aminotransferase class I and II, partial [Muribaculaceae bacterium]|nr:aminotransferase class I and II [Muribaculaceae bacterium]
IWNNQLWLIDHGASFYFHHAWRDPAKSALDPFPYIKSHVFLPYATKLEEADKLMRQAITPRTLSKIVDLLPKVWLEEENSPISADERREVYRRFLHERLKHSSIFVNEAIKQQKTL